MVLKIYKDTDPVLRTKCKPIMNLVPWVFELAINMWETMEAHHAVGIAANQVGFTHRIICVKGPEFEGVMINPELLDMSDHVFFLEEGCLSQPNIKAYTGKRSKVVKVKYEDISGETQTLWTKDLTAVIIQHEIDHLDGILMTDYLHTGLLKDDTNE